MDNFELGCLAVAFILIAPELARFLADLTRDQRG